MCVLCNCNDGLKSNFFNFFRQNFNSLGLKNLFVSVIIQMDMELHILCFLIYQSL